MRKIYLLFLIVLGSLTTFAQTVRYVKPIATGAGDGTSWADAAADLQTVINASSSGDQVWVAAGTYKPTIAPGSSTTDRDKTFLLKQGVSVYGGFVGTEAVLSARDLAANLTILSGDIGTVGVKTDNVYHVVAVTGNMVGARLDGFTITAGYADGTTTPTINGGSFHQGRAAGLFLSSTTGATFENLIISDNENATVSQNGGAAYFLYSSATLNNVEFKNNKSANNGGAIYMLGLTTAYIYPTFTNVKFTNNTALEGGAIYLSSFAQPTFTNTTFDGNEATAGSGGAITNGTATSSKITCLNVVFSNNKSTSAGGAVYNYGTSSTYTNCKFLANYTASSGAAMYLGGTASNNAAPSITNGVFANNTANNATYGGAIYNSTYTDAVLTNCTFYNNTNTNASNVNNGGAIAFFTSPTTQKITLQNSIFNGNEGDVYIAAGNTGASFTVKNCLMQTTTVATNGVNGNIVNATPTLLFASTVATDLNFLQLVEGEATQKGDNTLIPVGITTDLAGNSRVSSGVVDLGAYEFQGTLPVSLLSFNVAKKGASAVLTWKTASEQNNSKFVIERGSSPADFKILKEVAGAGDSNSPLSYSSTDFSPLSGLNYYRLTQYDKNGNSEVLGIQSLRFDLLASAKVYPNPAGNYVNVVPSSVEGAVSLNLISLTGKTVLTNNYAQTTTQEGLKLDLTNVPKGAYILWINKGKLSEEKQTLLVVK
ncbi:T9SS type A sorting domain-containing protein [Nubsella zeaxanthinifaciens]|uniref:T9SS type A sorting domain-containing protein n=1 Tax=Nubsella zeaxanthinifaciens TaxID=392412 RepID=UPI003CFDB79A